MNLLRSLLVMVALLGGLIVPATTPAKSEVGFIYIPLSYQQITSLSASTALTVPAQATMALISVEGAAIRYRDDGTAPTASVGMPVAVGQAFQYTGTLSAIRIIQQSASATINVIYYK